MPNCGPSCLILCPTVKQASILVEWTLAYGGFIPYLRQALERRLEVVCPSFAGEG